MKPRARVEGILAQDVDEEVIVYDKEHGRAHRLNRTSGIVWRQCDGERDVAAIAAVLRAEVGEIASEDLVLLTLDQLSSANLLEDAPKRSFAEARLSRRQFVRRAGVVGAGALLLPTVVSIVAPEPAAAQTCICAECCECCGCICCDCPCFCCACCG
jgi:hypothetical protein